MSFSTLKRNIVAAARVVACNPRLMPKDILLWSFSEEVVKNKLRPGEVFFFIGIPAVWVCIAAANDHRRPVPSVPSVPSC